MRGEGVIAVVETAYDVGGTEDEWLAAIGEAVHGAFGETYPVVVNVAERRPGNPFYVRSRIAYPNDQLFLDQVSRFERIAHRLAPKGALDKLYNRTACETALEAFRKRHLPPLFFRAISAVAQPGQGVRDVFNIAGTNPGGTTIAVMMSRDREVKVNPRVRDTWRRVGTHLAAALRLRTAAAGAINLDDATAIFDRKGGLIHTDDDTADGDARAALQHAAKAVTHARGALSRDDPHRAMELWRGLFVGKWSVVETFDTDGRAFIVALENEPRVAEDRRLTRRERQVAIYASRGMSDSDIGYALGISEASVRTHLSRGLIKLGVKNRMRLIKLAGALVGPGDVEL